MLKIIFTISALMTGCVAIQDIVPPFDSPYKINEANYMKTPCIVDGAVVEKKPKISNISNDSNTNKKR